MSQRRGVASHVGLNMVQYQRRCSWGPLFIPSPNTAVSVPLTVEQIRKLLFVARGHRLEALFILALATGMRRGELLGLKWQDINFATGTLQIRRILTRIPSKMPGKGYTEVEPKTQRSRRNVVIAPFALEALKQHHIHQLEAKLKAGATWQDHDYVFCTSIGTHLNPTRDILDELKQLLKKAELPNVRFHELSTTVPHNKWGGSRGSLPYCCLFRRLSLRPHLTKSAPG